MLPKIAKECCRKSLSRIKFLDWFVKVIGQFFLDVIGLKVQVALFKLSLVSFDWSVKQGLSVGFVNLVKNSFVR